LRVPRRVSVQWVAADPASAGFQMEAESVLAVSQFNHMMFNPHLPLVATAMQMTVGPHAWDKYLKEAYDLRKDRGYYRLPTGDTATVAMGFSRTGQEQPRRRLS